MIQFIVFLHVISAVALGYYLLFPFLASRVARADGGKAAGYAGGLAFFNRIGQYVLIIAFLSGGYLVSKYDYTTLWLVLTIAFVIIMFAMTGMMSRPLKSIASGDGAKAADHGRKVKLFSAINAISFLAILILMSYRGDFL